jgi:subtilase family serine protease
LRFRSSNSAPARPRSAFSAVALKAVVLVTACGCGIAWVPAASAAVPSSPVRVGAAPALPRGARTKGEVASEREISLTIALEPRDPVALEEFATAVATPGSSSFGQYLKVPEFASRFGASPEHVEAVAAMLEEEGLNIDEASANNLTLSVSGTAEQVETAFDTSLAKVELPSGRLAYANTRGPAVAAAIAPYVQGVVGLDDLALLEPADVTSPAEPQNSESSTSPAPVPSVITGGPQPCPAASAKGAEDPRYPNYTPDQIASAYQFSGLYAAGDFGAGQTIALTEYGEPYAPADIAAYQACFNTHATLIKEPIEGGPGPYHGDTGEEAILDIDVVAGLAPAATILVYEAPGASPVGALAAAVSQDRARTISDSFGLCEYFGSSNRALVDLEESLLQEAAVQGQSFFTASGDHGSEDCTGHNTATDEFNFGNVDLPASHPFATGVGGTHLSFVGPTPIDTIWNNGNGKFSAGVALGGGGGISELFAMPGYQSSAAGIGTINASSLAVECGGPSQCREVPDVSADADPYSGYVIYEEGAWGEGAGTSAAAPLWAALAALTDSYPTCRGRSIGFMNPALYALASTNYSGYFHDVVLPSPEGYRTNDSWYDGKYAYLAYPGYDMATGLGTPNASALAASLCAFASPPYKVQLTAPSQITGTVGSPISVQVSGSDSGNQPLTYTASGLPAGLTINPATGLISGTPQAPGQSTISVGASDPYTNSATISFSSTVVTPPVVKVRRARLKVLGAKLKGVAAGEPKLSLAFEAVGGRNHFGAVSVVVPRGLSFARTQLLLRRGVAVENAHGRPLPFASKVSAGKLSLKFGGLQKKIELTVSFPALRSESSFSKKVGLGKVGQVKLILSAKTKERTNSRVVHLHVH